MLPPGIINDFLSAHIFKVLGRITYGIYLLHSIVQLYKNAAGKAPLTFSNMNVVSLVNILVIFLLLFIFKELETFLLKDFIVFYCMKIFDFTLSGVIWNRLLRVFFFSYFYSLYVYISCQQSLDKQLLPTIASLSIVFSTVYRLLRYNLWGYNTCNIQGRTM